jgi:hypothetical protein
MIHLEEPRAYSPAGLGIALYEKVQEMTEGRARKAAAFLAAITCLELEGRELPDSAWCTLALIALSDLAQHAPQMTLVLRDWKTLHQNIARCSGEMSAEQMAASLAWAMSLRSNIHLEPQHYAAVNYSAIEPAACIRVAEAA